MLPRVGHIQFLNCLPLYYGLVKNGILAGVELVKGTPTELNRYLLEGKLDLTPISSIEYCRHYRELLLLPRLTVSSDGEVKSILLVSKVPVEQLTGDHRVALASTSATSQALLQIILRDRYSVTPNYLVYPPDLEAMLAGADAALLIGDHALRAFYAERGRLYIYTTWGANGKHLPATGWFMRCGQSGGNLPGLNFNWYKLSTRLSCSPWSIVSRT